MPPSDNPLPLLCHPATPAPMVRAIEACAARRPDGGLALAYRLWGDMARLRIPASQAPERTDLLWEHTCFEVFIGAANATAYREFNFSPSGQWAAYAFSDYRQRDVAIPPGTPPRITARLLAGRLELVAIVAPDALPADAGGVISEFRLGLSAVVEAADTVDDGHSYWALRHPAPRPDFHHRDAFTLALANPRNARNHSI